MYNRNGFRDRRMFHDSRDRLQNATMASSRERVHSTDEIRTVTGGQAISCVLGELCDHMTRANHSSVSRSKRSPTKESPKAEFWKK